MDAQEILEVIFKRYRGACEKHIAKKYEYDKVGAYSSTFGFARASALKLQLYDLLSDLSYDEEEIDNIEHYGNPYRST